MIKGYAEAVTSTVTARERLGKELGERSTPDACCRRCGHRSTRKACWVSPRLTPGSSLLHQRLTGKLNQASSTNAARKVGYLGYSSYEHCCQTTTHNRRTKTKKVHSTERTTVADHNDNDDAKTPHQYTCTPVTHTPHAPQVLTPTTRFNSPALRPRGPPPPPPRCAAGGTARCRPPARSGPTRPPPRRPRPPSPSPPPLPRPRPRP